MCLPPPASTTPAMTDVTPLPFDLPAVQRKKLTVCFDGGQLSSDGGLLVLRGAERRLGIADRLAGAVRGRRDPTRIAHAMWQFLEPGGVAICCGHEDGDALRRARPAPVRHRA